MRRAAVQAFRTARRTPVRKIIGTKSPLSTTSHGLNSRPASALRRYSTSPTQLQSSMYLRNFSLAFVSSLVAVGAWYGYRGQEGVTQSALSTNTSLSNATSISHSAEQTRNFSSASVFSTPSSTTPASISSEEATQSTRRALVVENDQFYTGNIVGDEPLSKDTDDFGRKVLEMMTPEQATERIRKTEESFLVGRGKGVVRYDVVQLPSNDPIEDDHAEKIVEVPQAVAATGDGATSSDWMFWGVFDGHSGWTTSAKLRQALISFVARELNSTYKAAATSSSSPFPTPEAIDLAIKQGFVRLDNEIVHESVQKVTKSGSKRLAAELLAPALSGSCALLSFYDSQSKTLRVACTGDSRAVLGRRGSSGKWVATALSEDQTGSTISEVTRLRSEHPGEENVVKNGRILGNLEPSRAFGDAFYKWSRETQDKIKKSFFGRTPHPYLKTPPYVTAEPIVTTTSISPENGDFVVMATDGLWEMLTNEEVVGLVGQWIEKQQNGAASGPSSKAWLSSWFSSSQPLPVEKGEKSETSGQRAPVRQQQYGIADPQSRFVVEDKNAATHLVRNALGGKDKDMVCALLTLPSPYSRRYRDDLTVEVIFFGNGDNSGNVVVNKEATASAENIKAKL